MCAQLFNSLVERISVERGNASGIGVGASRTSENAGRDEQNPCPVTGLLPDLLFVIHVRLKISNHIRHHLFEEFHEFKFCASYLHVSF